MVLAFALDHSQGISGGIYVLLIAIWAALTGIGSFHIRWNYYLKGLHRNKTTKNNWVAVTFDDGPHPIFTPQVLRLLRQYDAKATFFCIGREIDRYPEIVREIIAEGHTLGNHTYTHAKGLGFFSTDRIVRELKSTGAAIKHRTGLEPRLYRPAFGVTNPHISRAVALLGLSTIGWSIRSLDTTYRSKKTVLRRITRHLEQGDIILLHDTSAKTVEVLEQLLLFLQNKKMRSVTVDQLLDIKAYA